MTILTATTIAALRASLPRTAAACVTAIVHEVPGYDRDFDSALRRNIELAVQQALAAFLDTQDEGNAPERTQAMREGAYRLGQGEAVSGRSTDALLSAYRVGARVAWSQFTHEALAGDEPAANVAALAERTFVFIEELSAASLAGHTEAMTVRTRELSRRRDHLAVALIAGEARTALEQLAESAHWRVPTTLTSLVVDAEPQTRLLVATGERTLWVPAGGGTASALVPDLPPDRRRALLDACGPARAALGPSLAWHEAGESERRAQRALHFAAPHADANDLLPELALGADPLVAARLREAALAPLAGVSDAKREVLLETLLAWLLHQGRRDDVARALHVHPQTVRYRMTTLREAYGERLLEPRGVLELLLGLVAETVLRERKEP